MTENKKNMVFSDIDASITRLLHGLNYDNFQKQQDFLKSLKGNQETNNIVNGILDLLDRVADLSKNTTGKSLTNRFETIDNYIELLLQLENATDMEYTYLSLYFMRLVIACLLMMLWDTHIFALKTFYVLLV